MASNWMNNDGLFLTYGTDKTIVNKAGEYRPYGQLREVEVRITLSSLTETETILSNNTQLPAGARIQEVEIQTVTAAATGAAVDLGLIRSNRSTEINYDGLLAAYPTASMNADGERTVQEVGSTYAGALVGTTLAYNGYISASRTTSTAFTAGDIVVKIRYFIP